MNLSNGTRSEMINELKKSTCRVIFTKVNGDERNMVCTLDESIIPAPVVAAENRGTMIKEIQSRTVNEDVIPVWDITAEGWRSFRVDSVLSFVCEGTVA
jgi:hypothetical protein